mmetsp:Transcript_3890/g.16137  ORF Transcript_3890/g.16137 Transcript_3890/m.16137 type:complete len:235 (+) Transcript_3890:1648-2352(+)
MRKNSVWMGVIMSRLPARHGREARTQVMASSRRPATPRVGSLVSLAGSAGASSSSVAALPRRGLPGADAAAAAAAAVLTSSPSSAFSAASTSRADASRRCCTRSTSASSVVPKRSSNCSSTSGCAVTASELGADAAAASPSAAAAFDPQQPQQEVMCRARFWLAATKGRTSSASMVASSCGAPVRHWRPAPTDDAMMPMVTTSLTGQATAAKTSLFTLSVMTSTKLPNMKMVTM